MFRYQVATDSGAAGVRAGVVASGVDVGGGWWISRCRPQRLLAADRDRGQHDCRVVRRRSDPSRPHLLGKASPRVMLPR